ncbi:O-antigen ligase domain-containing protein [Rheinheimera mesophila]|uniref:O-antigen ligase domain-containing protein n=1 Tax=Rheinheimera mesophila TaxID=1547515 RepID=A0A3P3QQ35_9GAMM|nr:O-antigen ligase family protein [Rheinheimera mesophila]KKL00429.1 hypothetical protein SD53_14850 [Rheinheimera mesophila]RRJ23135.1 O-antigen ligase domain-containing protein [Rheinheimera mesophila]
MRLSSTYTHQKSINIYTFAVASVGFSAFTFSTLIPSHFAYMAVAFCLCWSGLLLLKNGFLEKKIFYFLTCFILPFLVSLISLPFAMVNEMHRFDYSQLSILGRLVNIFVFFMLILSIHQFSKDQNRLLLFKWYQIGIFMLLLTALWHAVSLYTGLVSWPFETRSNLHSAYGNEYSFTDRVTGIAREPSFFVMYVVDYIALSFVFFTGFRKLIAIFLACLLMVLSLSPSGYIVLFLCFSLSYLFSRVDINDGKRIAGFLVLSATMILALILLLKTENPFFEYILNRVTNVDPNNSGRLFMLLGPLEWIKDSSLFNFIFGHGMKSYAIIGTSIALPNGEPVHVTSNNLYIDVFWEAGIIGLILLLAYFLFVFLKIFKIKFSGAQRFTTFFVFFDLVFSAVFRADYASLRFFLMLFLLFILLNYDLGLEQDKHLAGLR